VEQTCTVATVSHKDPCAEKHSDDGAPNDHWQPRNSSVREAAAAEGLVVNMCDDGESSCVGLLAGRLDLLFWQQVAELT